MAAAPDSQDVTQGMCDKCFEGFKLDGTPAGSESKIGPFATYVAQPAQNASESTAVVLFTDVFGLTSPNSKLIADKIAEKTGFTVYVPDLFHGEPISDGLLKSMPQTAEQARSRGILSKVSSGIKVIGIVPWFLRHKPANHLPEAVEMVKVLRTEKGVTKLGAIGYCYGAPFATHFNSTGDVQATVLCHPSIIGIPELQKLKAPTSFAIGEHDSPFDEKLTAQAKEAMKSKDFETEFVVYKNTAHGFACRPNLEIEDVRKGFEGALAQTTRFLKKHLS